MTPNQLVAYNIRRARELKGWTQEQAAEEFEKYHGERWSKASWSAAERSAETERIRRFDADALFNLARTFEVPAGFSSRLILPTWIRRIPATCLR